MGTIVDTSKILIQEKMDCSDGSSSSSDGEEDKIQDLVIKSLSNIRQKLQMHNSQLSETSPSEAGTVTIGVSAERNTCFIIDKAPSNEQTFQTVTKNIKNCSESVSEKKMKKKRKRNKAESSNLFVIDKSPFSNHDSKDVNVKCKTVNQTEDESEKKRIKNRK